ncbi:hypothetical protein AGABI2DRAFT_186723 [Agaricus bisporus var. bisporus H97]|uniref:hypothetical protein n=1 Tax=Agaricus bisporus var. bisporus (strain H97 / ATCC MYA-4626 / FGSC 10389) TaxID=936046 RepID=UPI00029F6BFC|nr:hypothetical protein AGABI2DRAFT_186723 [Agaricus bisporus var. bisporus H97]EKV46085.1 hypothetical protein AGABI2DRAFT_186723 [Agaricus bisporus var. bisporus H97]
MTEYLVRRDEQYGSGTKVVREVDFLCDMIPKIVQDIERISTAKPIIKRDHIAMFSNTAKEM